MLCAWMSVNIGACLFLRRCQYVVVIVLGLLLRCCEVALMSGATQHRETIHGSQSEAVFWMWQRENPTSKLPVGWLESGVGEDSSASTSGDAGDGALHPMWDEYELSSLASPL
jgi:hypothetical protein